MSVTLFGVPQLVKEGRAETATPLQLSLPCLLLLYLLVRADWVSRAELAYLFRPDAPDATAKKHLRQLLHRAKALVWAEGLELKDELVRFRMPTDVLAFKEAIKAQNWQTATELYGDDLLSGYGHKRLETFNAWLDLERGELKTLFKLALKEQVNALYNGAKLEAAAGVAERYLKLDGLDEDVLGLYLKLADQLGWREKGLAAYKLFAEQLKAELNLDPLDETQQLARALGAARVASVATPPYNLPPQSTRFVGRKQDLTRLEQRLLADDCRVLSLVGFGGTGKTRLALELARRVLAAFKDGVYFVPLSEVTTKDALLSEIALHLDVRLSSRDHAEDALYSALAERQVLLVLDNVEQIAATPEFVTLLVKHTSQLKLLLTSRIDMGLNAEWLYDVQGLQYPDETVGEARLDYDAVRLFLAGVSKLNPDFVLQQGDADIIADITRRVAGLPLALELASRWHRLLSFKQILAELKTGLELLATTQADRPVRQRSLTVILDQTWQSLSPLQQTVLAGLSVFRGGFTLDAASAVTGAHLTLVLSLLNRGLVRKQANDRFDLHPLLKQYAAAQLKADEHRVARAHLDYYLALTKDGGKRVTEKGGEVLLNTFFLERENIFAALDYALGLDDPSDCQTLIAATWFFLHQKGLWLEALHYLGAVYAKGGLDDENKVIVLTGLGGMNIVLARFEAGERYALEAAALAEELGLDRAVQSNYGNLGVLLQRQGNYHKAHDYTLKAYKMSLKTGRNTDILLNNLGTNAILREDYPEARTYLLAALALIREKGVHNGLAMCLGNLVLIALALGQLDEAESYALEIETLDASNNMQIANHCRLSEIYAQKLELSKAQQHADRALATQPSTL